MRTIRLKDLCLTVTFVFIAVCAMMFAGCPLENNDALWEQVLEEEGFDWYEWNDDDDWDDWDRWREAEYTPGTPQDVTATAESSSSITVSWTSSFAAATTWSFYY